MAIHDLVPWKKNRGSEVSQSMLNSEPLRQLQQRMNSLFEDFFSPWFNPAQEWLTHRGTFVPKIDLRESDKEYRVTAELPGMDEKDVGVSLSGENLIIEGEKKEEHESEHDGYYRAERSYGAFRREISLPDVDLESVKAEFKKGVLRITLKKTPDAQSKVKRIPISTS